MIYLLSISTICSLPALDQIEENLSKKGVDPWLLVGMGLMAALLIGGMALANKSYSLSNIKSKTVGDGQHGTARWATEREMRSAFSYVPFVIKDWRKGEHRPDKQGLVLGCVGQKHNLRAIVDSDDIHCLMIGASGVGKTAFFLYPNLEYACASGMSFLALDTKGDLARNYGTIAQKYYGYQIAVIDLRNPTRSDGNNLLTLINRYMDKARADENDLASRAKAEKYAKILSKTIINPSDDTDHGQNAFFYDAAEGLLTAVFLLMAEFLPPKGDYGERRHIPSVFKLVQELLEPSKIPGKSNFQLLMSSLPSDHKARWFAGAPAGVAHDGRNNAISRTRARFCVGKYWLRSASHAIHPRLPAPRACSSAARRATTIAASSTARRRT